MCAYKCEGGRKDLGHQPKLKGVERRKLTAVGRETGDQREADVMDGGEGQGLEKDNETRGWLRLGERANREG